MYIIRMNASLFFFFFFLLESSQDQTKQCAHTQVVPECNCKRWHPTRYSSNHSMLLLKIKQLDTLAACYSEAADKATRELLSFIQPGQPLRRSHARIQAHVKTIMEMILHREDILPSTFAAAE